MNLKYSGYIKNFYSKAVDGNILIPIRNHEITAKHHCNILMMMMIINDSGDINSEWEVLMIIVLMTIILV